jgi:Dolichyl-phosphate-mannose-protein mannosyltransferase
VALLCLLLPGVIVCAVASFRWPLIHDAPLMDYIAWRITAGAVPYRDIFDMNMPGTYLVHIVALRLFGSGDLGWRLFDFIWLLLISVAAYVFCRPISRWGGVLSAMFFVSYHLSQGALSLGQRDFLLCLFLVAGAHLLARSVEEGGRRDLSFLAGLGLGFGTTMKPHVLLYEAAMLPVLIAFLLRQRRLAWKQTAALFVVGAAVAPSATALWLARVGGLDPLIQMVTGYLIPYYPKLGGVSASVLAWRLLKPSLFWILVAVAVPWPRSARGPRYALAILGACYGVAHYALQERGWWYHEYPFHLFLYILVAVSLGGLLSRPEWKRRLLALLCLFVFLYPLTAACYRVARQPMSGEEALGKKELLDGLVAYLRPRVDPARDTVQTMDTAAGGVDALWVLHVREATRFMYDFHLLYFSNEPFVRQMRSEFMSAIRAARPKYVILFRWSWPPPSDYQRFQNFPEFCQWLDEFYVKDYEQPGYRIFRRKSDVSPASSSQDRVTTER